MAYDEQLAARVRRLLSRQPELSERKMFGGLCFLLHGHMCCGVLDDQLIVRVESQHYDAAMNRPHTRVMDMTGRPMKGFVVVLPKGYATGKALGTWLAVGSRCAHSQSSKRAKKKPRKKSWRLIKQ
ncbi:MAG: TfoX/Sxy family protein [Gammaproteobacteria bacterium]|nr:TfoX/Sxy family protein [Gammaproteobacteria bacterium]